MTEQERARRRKLLLDASKKAAIGGVVAGAAVTAAVTLRPPTRPNIRVATRHPVRRRLRHPQALPSPSLAPPRRRLRGHIEQPGVRGLRGTGRCDPGGAAASRWVELGRRRQPVGAVGVGAVGVVAVGVGALGHHRHRRHVAVGHAAHTDRDHHPADPADAAGSRSGSRSRSGSASVDRQLPPGLDRSSCRATRSKVAT